MSDVTSYSEPFFKLMMLQILPLENRLTERKAMLGLNGVLCSSINLVIVLYAAVGFYGYLCFGDDVQASISLNLPKNVYAYYVS